MPAMMTRTLRFDLDNTCAPLEADKVVDVIANVLSCASVEDHLVLVVCAAASRVADVVVG